jgi:hypothetical protein
MVKICECGHEDVAHNRKSCKGITTQSHKGLDWSKCRCKKLDIRIDTSLPNIHIL